MQKFLSTTFCTIIFTMSLVIATSFFTSADDLYEDVDEFIDPGLGGGADAYWADDGSAYLEEDGTSGISTLVIRGRDLERITVNVLVFARFGPYQVAIFENDIEVMAEELIPIPIDLLPATGIHEKQANYVTAVKAVLTEKRSDGSKGYRKILDPLYLAWDSGAQEELVMDAQTQKDLYPGGVVGEAERAIYETLLQESESEGILLFIEPGIPIHGKLTQSPDAGADREGD